MSARTWFTIDALLVVANLLSILLFHGGLLNAVAAVYLTIPAVNEFHAWRASINEADQ